MTKVAGCEASITELIAGFAGLNGKEIRFQPGFILSFTALGLMILNLDVISVAVVAPAAVETLPAKSVAFSVMV